SPMPSPSRLSLHDALPIYRCGCADVRGHVEVAGWVLDKSAAARASDPSVGRELEALAGSLFICPVGELEQLYSARSARDYDALRADLRASLEAVAAPGDILDRALNLQRDLAHHHGMWLRTPILALLI